MDVNEILAMIKAALTLMGLVFLISGLQVYLAESKKKKLCNQEVVATVVDVQRSDCHSMEGSYGYSWYPIYEYEFNGRIIRRRSDYGRAKRDTIGKTVSIYVNEVNPEMYYCPEEKAKLFTMIFCGIGLFLLIVVVILVLIKYFAKI